jgi:hypothetical protein
MKFGRAAASRHHHPGVQRRHQHPADAAIDHAAVNTPLRVLICYDREDDDTLPAIRNHRAVLGALTIAFVRTSGRGAHGAVLSGFAASCCRRTTIITSAFSTAGADDVPAGFGARHQQQLADAARIGVANHRAVLGALTIAFVRTSGRGAHGAVLSGFAASLAPSR